MITKVNVVYHKGTELTAPTEHVLAAVVRTAEPSGSKLTLEQLVKPSLLVRGWSGSKELLFHVLPSELGAEMPDVDGDVKDVQGNPLGFRLEDGKLLKKLSTDSVDAATTFTTANHAHVQLSTQVAEETPVWIQIEGGIFPESEPLNLTGKILPPLPSPGAAIHIEFVGNLAKKDVAEITVINPLNSGSPSVTTVRQGAVGVNEVQRLSITGPAPTSGNFKLKFDGQTTGNIAFNANALNVQNALVALSNIGANNVSCTSRGVDIPIQPPLTPNTYRALILVKNRPLFVHQFKIT